MLTVTRGIHIHTCHRWLLDCRFLPPRRFQGKGRHGRRPSRRRRVTPTALLLPRHRPSGPPETARPQGRWWRGLLFFHLGHVVHAHNSDRMGDAAMARRRRRPDPVPSRPDPAVAVARLRGGGDVGFGGGADVKAAGWPKSGRLPPRSPRDGGGR